MSIWDTPTTDEKLDDRQHADEVTFIGQDHIKAQVEAFINTERFPHVLLTGDPGLGKTQFAKWLAWQREKPFFERLAPVKPEELPPYGILLLDEVHRQARVESLFPTMDKGILTFIAATTKPDKLDSAFKSRFLISLRLRPYLHEEMVKIINHMAGEDVPSANVLANAANGNPRLAERLVRTGQGLGTWDAGTLLKSTQITADGLHKDHFDYLAALDTINRPVGVKQLGEFAWLSEADVKRVERVLVLKGFVELSPSGRKLTIRGQQYVQLLKDEGVL